MATPIRLPIRGADTAGDAVRQTIRAFHGSPYDFDKFDASKIGTGEGAQAYGHGLYFAGDPRVAADYRSQLAGTTPLEEVVVAGRRVSPSNRWNYSPRNNSVEENVLSTLLENLLLDEHGLRAAGPNARDLAIGTLRSRSKHYPQEWPEAVEAAAALEKKMMAPDGVRVTFGQQPGRMYEVELGVPESAMLDWDAPMSRQPKVVQKLFGDMAMDMPGDGGRVYRDIATRRGEEFDDDLTGVLANLAASQELMAEGIPGIRYFDGMSRGSGQGTRNYVMFPGTEDSIRILRKYGLLAPMAAAGTMGEE